VASLSATVQPVLSRERADELAKVRAARAALWARVRRLPRSAEEADVRLGVMQERVGQVERSAYRLVYLSRECGEIVSGTQSWMDEHRAELSGSPEARDEVSAELRKHRSVIDGYEAELRALKRQIDVVHDVAGGSDALVEEARLRAQYLDAIERERDIAVSARGSLADPAQQALFDRAEGIRERIASVRARSRALKIGLASEGAERSAQLRAKVAAEKIVLAGETGTLDGVQGVSKEIVGTIAVRALQDVRQQFYRLVLKADLGIVDVAWSRKRARLEKVQQLSMQKATEVEQLDRDFRVLQREVE
jgi:hypothetical protein